jgi:ABC-2 type transport system ATP-binding protein
MDEAERFDRVAFLDRGRLLALETPERLRRDLPGELLAVRVARVREARAAAVALPEVRRAAVFGDRLHLSVASAERDGPAVTAALARAGFPVLELTAIEPSMEDVFIERIAGRGSSA